MTWTRKINEQGNWMLLACCLFNYVQFIKYLLIPLVFGLQGFRVHELKDTYRTDRF